MDSRLKSGYPVLWFMGMSGSGKSTVSDIVLQYFPEFHFIDNDSFRKKYPNSFTREMRIKTCTDLLHCAKEESSRHPVLVNKITPYEEIRSNNRRVLGTQYHEIYCKCPLSVLFDRDVKGLYKKALEGSVQHMIGVSLHEDDVYEEPTKPNLVLDTTQDISETTEQIITYVKRILGNK